MDVYISFIDIVAYHMIPDINVLGPLVVYLVVSDIFCSSVVATNANRTLYLEILFKFRKAMQCFFSSFSECHVFSLN